MQQLGTEMLDRETRTEVVGRWNADSDTSCISRYVKLFTVHNVSVFNGRLTNLSRIEKYSSRNLGQY